MTQAVLLGGLFIGVLSALPIVNVADCCCLWVIAGGAITALLAQEQDPRPLDLMTGARMGFRAGVFGAVVWLFASAAIEVVIAPLQRGVADLMLQNAADMPGDVRSWLDSVSSSASLPARLVFGFFLQLFASPFAALGGLLGTALVSGNEQPQQP